MCKIKKMKKKIVLISSFFVLFFLVTSCDKNYQYGFTSIGKKNLEDYEFSMNEITSTPEIVNEFPNNTFSPSEYDLGRVFKDYNEIEEYFIELYGIKSKYNNKEQFELAKETGIFKVTSLDQKTRTFVFTDDGIVLKSYGCNDLSFNHVFSNYDENDYKLIKKVFPEIFEKNHIYKYYNHGNGVYKYSFFNAGHLHIGINRIDFVK